MASPITSVVLLLLLLAAWTPAPSLAGSCFTDDYWNTCGNSCPSTAFSIASRDCDCVLWIFCSTQYQCRKNNPSCCAGYYSTSCVDCTAGSFCPGGTGGPRTSCSAGTYSGALASSCTNCGANTFNPNTGSTSSSACLNCPSFSTSSSGSSTCNCNSGYYRTGSGSSISCVICPAGSSCSNNVQTLCPANQFQASTGTSSCQACPSFSSSSQGATTCTCQAGRYMSGGQCILCEVGYRCPGDNSRYICTDGTFQDSTGKSACTSCPANSFSSSGASVCTCTTGRYMNAGSCDPCPAGSFCTAGTNTKQFCSAGQFQDLTMQSSCKSCPSFSTSTSGATVCTCDATRFMNSTVCSLCLAGNYCPGTNQQLACFANQYQDQTGQSSCKSCPSFSTSSSGATFCTCDVGYYAVGLTTCTACTAGYFCTGNNQRQTCGTNTYTATTGNNVCKPCPTGSTAPSGSTTCTCDSALYSQTGTGDSLVCTLLGALSVDPGSRFVDAEEGALITVRFLSNSLVNANCTVSVLASSTAPAEDYTLLTPTLLRFFAAAGNYAELNISITDFEIPRTTRNILLRISNPVGAVLSPYTDAEIAIQAANIPGGVFQFASASRNVAVSESAASFELTVERLNLFSGTVNVTIARSDGQPSLFTQFTPGATSRSVSVPLSFNGIPALNRTITFSITSLSGNLVPAGFLGTFKAVNVTILESWNARGVFSLSSPTYVVGESSGAVVLGVLRTGGLFGTVRVDVAAMSGTAVSGLDFVPYQTTLLFGPGDSNASISLSIIDDNIPELNEQFFVYLANATGGAVLSTTDTVNATVTILENDQPHGLLQFQNLTVSVNESAGVAEVTVLRTRGTFGTITFFYSTSGGSAETDVDFVGVTSQSVTMVEGQSVAKFNITLIDDGEPEQNEVFYVNLFSATGGADIGLLNQMSVVILANDYPNGVFSLTAGTSLSSIVLLARGTPYTVEVQRTAGAFGSVTVKVKSFYPFSGEATTSDINVDTNLVFPAGERFMSLNITPSAISGEIPPRRFVLSLQIVSGGGIVSAFTSTSYFVIEARSANAGVASFALTKLTTPEGIDAEFVIRRLTTGSPTSAVSVMYRTIMLSTPPFAWDAPYATQGADYNATSGVVTFAPGVTEVTLNVSIVADGIPENEESFAIELFNATGGMFISGISQLPVVIAANDDAFGVFQFVSRSSVVSEKGETVTINVTRTGGNFSDVTVVVELLPTAYFTGNMTIIQNATVGADFASAPNHTLTFHHGERNANFSVGILDNNLYQGNKAFSFRLTSSNRGSSLHPSIDKVVTTVYIFDDESPPSSSSAMVGVAVGVAVPIVLCLVLLVVALVYMSRHKRRRQKQVASMDSMEFQRTGGMETNGLKLARQSSSTDDGAAHTTYDDLHDTTIANPLYDNLGTGSQMYDNLRAGPSHYENSGGNYESMSTSANPTYDVAAAKMVEAGLGAPPAFEDNTYESLESAKTNYAAVLSLK